MSKKWTCNKLSPRLFGGGYKSCDKPATWVGKPTGATRSTLVFRCDDHTDDLEYKMALRKEEK